MKKVKAKYETIVVGKKRIRFKFWPSENGPNPDKLPQYVGLLTRVDSKTIERVERAISKKYQIRGIFGPRY